MNRIALMGAASALVAFAGVARALPPEVRVVRAGAPSGGNGLSWATAYPSLQSALDAASGSAGQVSEIWVAAGSYAPSTPINPGQPASRSFLLVPNVRIFGGFAGNETERDHRNPAANITILDGNANPTFEAAIVTASSGGAGTILDGFVLSGGFGGGMRILGASPTVRGCTLEMVGGDFGAAFHINGGAPLIDQCLIVNNVAFAGSNGAVQIVSGTPRFTDSVVTQNTLHLAPGAGVKIAGGTPVFERVTFSSNHAPDGGGGAVFGNGATFVGCQFRNNSALGGAAIWGNNHMLVSCTFMENTGAGGWGAVHGSGNTFINCTFRGNVAELQQGGSGAGGITGEAIRLYNSILWGNCAPAGNCGAQENQINGSIAECRFTSVQGWANSIPGVGCDGVNPMLADALGRLGPGSPAINAGENAAVPRSAFFDADHNWRFHDGPAPNTGSGPAPVVDRGAFEFGAVAYCYPNMDQSSSMPILDASDFAAFLQHFSAGHPMANCDASTRPPVLNVADFTCFLQRFAAGCP